MCRGGEIFPRGRGAGGYRHTLNRLTFNNYGSQDFDFYNFRKLDMSAFKWAIFQYLTLFFAFFMISHGVYQGWNVQLFLLPNQNVFIQNFLSAFKQAFSNILDSLHILSKSIAVWCIFYFCCKKLLLEFHLVCHLWNGEILVKPIFEGLKSVL